VEAILVVGIVIALISAFGGAEEKAYVARRLRRSVPEPLAALADGRGATAGGTVRTIAAGRVVSPLGGVPCVFWMVRFDEVGAGDSHTLGRATGGCEFLVENATGTARIIPDHAKVDVPGRAFSCSSRLWVSGRPDLVTSLAKQHCKPPNRPSETVLRATEHVIEEGMSIVVNGNCTREPDPSAVDAVTGYREQLPSRPVLSGSRRWPLVIRCVAPAGVVSTAPRRT
jgi:hypothetical protein